MAQSDIPEIFLEPELPKFDFVLPLPGLSPSLSKPLKLLRKIAPAALSIYTFLAHMHSGFVFG